MSSASGVRTVELPPTARSASEGRHFVVDTLTAWGMDGLVDVAALVTTEVVTNAVLHARTSVRLTIRRDGARGISIAVRDGSQHRPQRRRTDADSTSGRGMELLDLLATSWSVDVSDSGKTVLFSLDGTSDPWGSGDDPTWLDEAEL
jgi:two-component sensor histidine kinase